MRGGFFSDGGRLVDRRTSRVCAPATVQLQRHHCQSVLGLVYLLVLK